MIRVKIIGNGLNSFKDFISENEADAYIKECEDTRHWGNPAYDEIIEPAEKDENGIEIKSAIIKHHEAEIIFTKEDITAEYNLNKLMNECEDLGQKQELACHGCLRIIGGYNDMRALTLDKILSMASTFSQVETFLNRRMPKTAKQLINAIVPDGDIVTQELKDLLLNKLKEF